MEEIYLEDMGIYVRLIRKNIRHTYLKIKRSSGEVQLVAPINADKEDLIKFLGKKQAWIMTHLNKGKDLKKLTRISLRDGEKIPIFNRQLQLKINYIKKNPLYVEEENGRLVVNIKEATGEARGLSLVKEWYRKELENEIALLLKKWEEKMDIRVASVRTKKMKTRWGTCNVTRGNIWINLELAKLPKKYLEYVLVHEMVHLFERGHGAGFKRKMTEVFPGWEKIQGELDGYLIHWED